MVRIGNCYSAPWASAVARWEHGRMCGIWCPGSGRSGSEMMKSQLCQCLGPTPSRLLQGPTPSSAARNLLGMDGNLAHFENTSAHYLGFYHGDSPRRFGVLECATEFVSRSC